MELATTKLNVADEGTKWKKLPDLTPSSRWCRGPSFIWKPKAEWPLDNREPGTTSEELRSHVLHHSPCDLLICVDRFSKWKRLLRTVAYVLRFPTNIRLKRAGRPINNGPLSQDELRAAENVIYQQTQLDGYPEEVKIMRRANPTQAGSTRLLPRHSSLYKLCPTTDEHGILRMQGRITNCRFIEGAAKFPVLLPKTNHVT